MIRIFMIPVLLPLWMLRHPKTGALIVIGFLILLSQQ
jgi:hypothetical protein